MKRKFEFNDGNYAEIKSARKKNRDKQVDKRLLVLELRCQGKSLVEIAGITNFHRSYVSSIIRKYFEEGIESVAEKHYHGNRRNMSVEEEAAFLEQFFEKAEEGQMLDIHEVRAEYEKAVGHTTGCAQVYRILHRHGWRKVMPRSRHPKKADEEVIETSKKLTTPSEN